MVRIHTTQTTYGKDGTDLAVVREFALRIYFPFLVVTLKRNCLPAFVINTNDGESRTTVHATRFSYIFWGDVLNISKAVDQRYTQVTPSSMLKSLPNGFIFRICIFVYTITQIARMLNPYNYAEINKASEFAYTVWREF